MGDVPAKRAFYRSALFQAVVVYAVACAIGIAYSEAHLGSLLFESTYRWEWAKWWAPDYHGGVLILEHRAWLPIAPLNEIFERGYRCALLVTPFVAGLGGIFRVVARARVRAGQADPLERVRAFAKKRVFPLVALPALVWWACEALRFTRSFNFFGSWIFHGQGASALVCDFALVSLAAGALYALLVRVGLAALLAPTIDENVEAEKAGTADDFEFSAVAVTREAVAAVKRLAVLTVGMLALVVAVPTFDDGSIDVDVAVAIQSAFDVVIALYVIFALVSAFRFRRASRIHVGLDGIHVYGTSRSRFIAFHELDGVRSRRTDIELVRGDSVVLRLQLHGPDAVRREALTQRISDAIARATEERDKPITRFVNAATHEDLSRAADGACSYRHAAVSRDQLWAALEGPAVASGARIAAAKALATSTDAAERARFRVAADQCADPSARAELLDLLDDEPDELASPRSLRRAAS